MQGPGSPCDPHPVVSLLVSPVAFLGPLSACVGKRLGPPKPTSSPRACHACWQPRPQTQEHSPRPLLNSKTVVRWHMMGPARSGSCCDLAPTVSQVPKPQNPHRPTGRALGWCAGDAGAGGHPFPLPAQPNSWEPPWAGRPTPPPRLPRKCQHLSPAGPGPLGGEDAVSLCVFVSLGLGAGHAASPGPGRGWNGRRRHCKDPALGEGELRASSGIQD